MIRQSFLRHVVSGAGFAAALVVAGSCRTRSVAEQPSADAALESLGWLSGSWIGRDEHGETEEHWLPPKANLMLGVNRTVGKSGSTSFEFLRIVRVRGGIRYIASPGGKPPTEFTMVKQEENHVTFENLQHDFPQRIVYWLDEKQVLHARIEGTVRGELRGREFQWKKNPSENEPSRRAAGP